MAVKAKKKASSIDMTAMCDVSFLLLTFFILTATAKVPEAMPVDMPSSTLQEKLPESNLAIITIGKDEGKNKIFLNIKGRDVKIKTLEKMSEKFNLKFTEEEKQMFALIDDIGVPADNLKELISMTSSERNKEGVQPGIPKDSLNNQLADWIRFARFANVEANNKELGIAIKGDQKEQYPEIQSVMDILQEQGVNNFFLVTGFRKASEK